MELGDEAATDIVLAFSHLDVVEEVTITFVRCGTRSGQAHGWQAGRDLRQPR